VEGLAHQQRDALITAKHVDRLELDPAVAEAIARGRM
jgi:hypothetical protein